MAEMIQTLLMMYMLLIADIPYGFRMIGSMYDDEPFRFKQLDKMVFKGFRGFDHNELVENSGLHSMDQGYSMAQTLRSCCHGVENLAWYDLFND